MAKVYKATFYIADSNDEYMDRKRVKQDVEEKIRGIVSHVEVEESLEFEWDNNLKINLIDSTKEDFEAYLTPPNSFAFKLSSAILEEHNEIVFYANIKNDGYVVTWDSEEYPMTSEACYSVEEVEKFLKRGDWTVLK